MPGLFVNLLGHPNVHRKVRKGQTTPAQADQGSKTIDSFENKEHYHEIEGYSRPNAKQKVY